MISSWELNFPPNWHSYSSDKKIIGIFEIIFIKNENINSHLRKNIIIDMDFKITCNILGKNITDDMLNYSLNKITNQQHLKNITKEVVSVKICRGIDFLYTKK